MATCLSEESSDVFRCEVSHEVSEAVSHEAPSWSASVVQASVVQTSRRSASAHRLSDVMCKNPYMAGLIPFGCGQCLPCRINRRRQWAARQELESYTHDENAFVTLTYDDDHIPRTRGGRPTLDPTALQLFLKRLRQRVDGTRIRYFAVGEYGSESERPHYHLSLFGMSGFTVFPRYAGGQTGAEVIAQAWGHGFTLVAEFNSATAQYVTGYVTKKMTSKTDARLDGRHPEFARMSLKPAIGADAMKVAAATLAVSGNVDVLDDVPNALKVGRRSLALGRTMLRKLREASGYTDEYIARLKQEVSYARSLEMLVLFADQPADGTVATFKQGYLKSVAQKIRQLETRTEIYEQVRKL